MCALIAVADLRLLFLRLGFCGRFCRLGFVLFNDFGFDYLLAVPILIAVALRQECAGGACGQAGGIALGNLRAHPLRVRL